MTRVPESREKLFSTVGWTSSGSGLRAGHLKLGSPRPLHLTVSAGLRGSDGAGGTPDFAAELLVGGGGVGWA